jgi:hypothetical protein
MIGVGGAMFLWCAACLVLIAVGEFPVGRPNALARYVTGCLVVFYVPMLVVGWRIVAGSRRAFAVGYGLAVAFFLYLFGFTLYATFTGESPVDMGGLPMSGAAAVAVNLLVTSLAAFQLGAFAVGRMALNRMRAADAPGP